MIISPAAKAETSIFDLFVIPNMSKNNGNRAVAGIERKKSIKNSTLRYILSVIPNNNPVGKPSITAIEIEIVNLTRVDRMSCKNVTSPKRISASFIVRNGSGNNNGSNILSRVTTNQMAINAIGPMIIYFLIDLLSFETPKALYLLLDETVQILTTESFSGKTYDYRLLL